MTSSSAAAHSWAPSAATEIEGKHRALFVPLLLVGDELARLIQMQHLQEFARGRQTSVWLWAATPA
jgi:hypothetical protein